ncbi:MAG: hypothetical protein LM580_12610 [Thermofilum sp.]|nr:hypothetical protein [Thermofilum sp.]
MKKGLPIVVTAVFLAAIVLAQTKPIQITSVVTKNYDGNPTTTFRKGEIIIVETTITYTTDYYYYAYGAPSYSYLELITMWYKSTMMGLTLTRDTITPGASKTFGGGIPTRPGDPTGTYTFKVMVWNGFPSEKGAAWASLADPQTVTVTVNP